MNFTLRLTTLLAITSAALLLTACQKDEETSASPAAAPTPQGSAASATPATNTEALRLVDASGATLVTLQPRALQLVLGTGSNATTLQSKAGEEGKRKYARLGEGVVMEVKPEDDGLKLRGADGHLLWKLKLQDSGMKISDNEKNARPITLKIKDDQIDVADNGKMLGQVEFDGDKGRAKVTDASGKTVWTVQARKISAAFGLHLATRIPENERAVLELELLARGL